MAEQTAEPGGGIHPSWSGTKKWCTASHWLDRQPGGCGRRFQEVFWPISSAENISRRRSTAGPGPAHHPQFQPPGDRLPWRRRVVPPLSERADAPVQFQTPEQTGLWSALSSLPDGLRVPLYLFYFEELSTQEIARLLSLRPGAVRMRLSRGREHLRELLKGDYFHE